MLWLNLMHLIATPSRKLYFPILSILSRKLQPYFLFSRKLQPYFLFSRKLLPYFLALQFTWQKYLLPLAESYFQTLASSLVSALFYMCLCI